ncbi:trans-aconitate 2-methyltransferase [Tenggerimyces flavus]|uniref:Trans-aconitate 2-methyltransferase n=1 Tax=Tenggerimyces flavus TaxID=1708749 RepID=A0ABV7Y786_9ACTN|nr:trans-aconitate 2-methyltransferase [Tenggerimyces flavus]MBM7785585.1 trans-aconitate 2-methyltransferase [Tenggerimyces flavus]
MTVVWDPGKYLQFANERGRPFGDLLARVGATDPSYVVDLGCGPGNLTATLLDRWPGAYVEGLDSSAEMISSALALSQPGRLEFTVGDLRAWAPSRPVDVLVSNATLQWVPDHISVLPDLVEKLAPGGWIAIQMPGNFDAPTHTILRALAESPEFAGFVPLSTFRPAVEAPERYLEVLDWAGCTVDAWETTYLHVLEGEDAAFEWIKGTGARPILQALPDDVRPAFEAEYRSRLRSAYPAHSYGTVLSYRRVFAVGRKDEA